MKTICLLIPYFGKWPEWFPLFLQSCRYNPTINWHFFTDCDEPPIVCSNVEYSRISYPDYQQLVSERLNIRFTGRPYKLCDLRPALGFVHERQLESYDYSGFGDLDVIYGDLRKFITPEMLTKKLISTHSSRVSGHFCLIKNSVEMRNLFREIPDWGKLFEHSDHRGADESQFTKLFVKHRKQPEWVKRLSPRYRDCCFKEQYSTVLSHNYPWIDGSPNYPTQWHWEKGTLTASGYEMMYLHFMNWKSGRWHHRDGTQGKAAWENLNPLVQFPETSPENFWIDAARGFIRQP